VFLQVLKNFPDTLQADVCLYLNDKLLSECVAFRSASPGHRYLTMEYCVFPDRDKMLSYRRETALQGAL